MDFGKVSIRTLLCSTSCVVRRVRPGRARRDRFGGWGHAGSAHSGDEHGHAPTVALVQVPEGADQIALLQLKGNEDVAGRDDSEEEAAGAPDGGGPEGEEEAGHDGRPDVTIEGGRLDAELPQP